MIRQFRWQGTWTYVIGSIALGAMGYGIGYALHEARLQAAPPAETASLPTDTALAAETRLALLSPSDNEEVVLAQRKRVMGRLKSLDAVRRVATMMRPLVDRALRLPAVQGDLAALARSAGVSVEQYRGYFAAKQEADLLLESGGDPNARSVSDAIGVAQFMVGTGQRCGLAVNLSASNLVSRQISALEKQIDSLSLQPETWTKPVPKALRGVVPTLPTAASGKEGSQLPAAGSAATPEDVWTRDQWIAYRKSQWDRLVAKRRQVDHRFDPKRAIPAQTRYLLSLTRRYGGVDWALQAYHGGEAGAAKTMRLFASEARTVASRGWVPYSLLYAHVSPTGTPSAFSYLFGRSDDHRYYWWKVLMAERALNLYRQDPEEFEREWQALHPGLSSDAVYYPEPESLQFADDGALRAAYLDGTLVALPANAASLGVRTENLAALDPSSAGLQKGLRPEAMGALLRLVGLYRGFGGRDSLVTTSLVQSNAYRRLWEARYPSPPPVAGVPRDPEFHTTGLTFDLVRPERDWDRKVLEYALGRLSDTLRISWRPERSPGGRRYHVVVNPAYRREMVDYYQRAVHPKSRV